MKALKRWLGLGGSGQPSLRVLMVCSGNICRSPTAEAVLRAKLARAGMSDRIEVDSAGTQGLHAKEAPDPRAQAHASRRGYDLSKLRARKIEAEDFLRFQHIIAMDEGHLAWLQGQVPPDARSRLGLLMAHATRHPGQAVVPDPYYGSAQDFERVLDLVEDACDGLVRELGQALAGQDRGASAKA